MNEFLKSQHLVYTTILNMIKRDKLPHALIFSYGNKDFKIRFTKYFIKMVYSKYFNKDIDLLEQNKRIDDESFTNVTYIRSDTKTSTSIDSVRGLSFDNSMSSLEDGPRFYVFVDGDTLNNSSSNAILKFTEEPIDNTYIVFLIDNPSNLIDTIKSRCVELKFKSASKDEIVSELCELGYDKDLVKVFTEYKDDVETIKYILDNKGLVRIYDFIISLFNTSFEKRDSIITYLNENYYIIDSKEDTNNDLKKSIFISLLIMYLRDIMLIKNGYTSSLVFNDKERMEKISLLYSMHEINDFIKDLMLIKELLDIKESFNFHLYLDNLFLKMEIKGRR